VTDTEATTDVIIIGGGPAGLSAAVWCSDLGIRCVLVEREDDIGGQLHKIHNPIDNYLGVQARDGQEMLEHFRGSLDRRDLVRRLQTEVSALEPSAKMVRFGNGESLSAKFLIVATGVRRRTLGIPGEKEFKGRGIIESGARDKTHLRGKRALIVGGGDAAIENAAILSEFAASVKIAFRKSAPTARGELLSTIGSLGNVELMPSSALVELRGNDRVEHAILRDTVSRHEWEEPVDAVLIRIGVEPNTEFLRQRIDLDQKGYVRVTHLGETSEPNIFAVGDVASPIALTLATAVGMGATAGKVIGARLSRI
jgi:thioredoxin reductase (NADPH)